VIGYLISPALKTKQVDDWVSLGSLDSYPVGTPKLFTFTRTSVNGWERTAKSFGVYVVRKSESEEDVEVFSNVCTHLSCRVKWDGGQQEYICPCHGAHFSIDGEVESGPPPRPLDQYEFKIENGDILIHLTEG